MIVISVMTSISSLYLSIQATLSHAMSRPKRFYTVEIIRNLSICLSSIPSRTCELTTLIYFTFIGGTGILVLKKLWGHSTPLFSKEKFYIWYVLSQFLNEFISGKWDKRRREHLISQHGSSQRLTSTRVTML